MVIQFEFFKKKDCGVSHNVRAFFPKVRVDFFFANRFQTPCVV